MAVGQVVEKDNLMPGLNKRHGSMATNVSRSTRQQNIHAVLTYSVQSMISMKQIVVPKGRTKSMHLRKSQIQGLRPARTPPLCSSDGQWFHSFNVNKDCLLHAGS